MNRAYEGYARFLEGVRNSTPAAIAESLDAKQASPGNWIARCPAHEDKNPSLSISEGENGRLLLQCFAGCTFEEIYAAIGRPRPAPAIDRPKVKQENDKGRERLRKAWNESEPLDLCRHELAACYFQSRGLRLDHAPSDLRFHPALPYWTVEGDKPELVDTFPAILALVRAPDGKVMTLHRTYLAKDGSGKADVPSPRKMFPPWKINGTRSAAIRLYAAGDTLAVAEGIETALAVRLLSGLAVWATISAHGMASIQIPDTVKKLVICADSDAAGKDAAARLVHRYLSKLEVKTAIPEQGDWLDVWRAKNVGS